MIRNFKTDQEEHLEYKHGKIKSWRQSWEEFDEKKDKWVTKKQIFCLLIRGGKFLNLGECCDGSPFSAVSQAINEAKWLVDYDIERELDIKLLKTFHRDDLNKYNSLKIWDRIEKKKQLLK